MMCSVSVILPLWAVCLALLGCSEKGVGPEPPPPWKYVENAPGDHIIFARAESPVEELWGDMFFHCGDRGQRRSHVFFGWDEAGRATRALELAPQVLVSEERAQLQVRWDNQFDILDFGVERNNFSVELHPVNINGWFERLLEHEQLALELPLREHGTFTLKFDLLGPNRTGRMMLKRYCSRS